MKIGITTFLATLALAGLCSVPAYAGDGEKEKPTSGPAGGEAKGATKGEKECPEGAKDGKECAKEGEGKACCKDGKECCKESAGCSDLEIVTLAAVEGTSESAKKVLAAVPAAAAEKVEAARKNALEQLAKIHGAMAELKVDFDEACAEAKAKGAEVCCDMKATFEKDMKTLHGKAKEQIEACAKTIRESIGEDRIKELSADCRKAGDMAKAVAAKVQAAAAKLLEKKKTCEDADEGECDADEGKKEGECQKDGEKKPETKKPDAKDPQ